MQIALEWTNPLRDAHLQAFKASDAYVRGGIDELQFRQKYPKAIRSDLARFSLPTHLRFHIPEDMYDRIFEIIAEFDQLFELAFKQKGKGAAGKQVIIECANQIRKHIYSLRDDLSEAAEKTFE